MNKMVTSRSYLFVPGNRPDRFDKALACGADSVVIDLEDGVVPGQKDRAREEVAEFLSPGHSFCVRVNGTDTEWFDSDRELCSMAGVNSIMLPKIESVEQIKQVTGNLAEEKPVLALIETAKGYWNMHDIACAGRVQRLVFGALDFIMDLGMDAQGDELNAVRLQMVIVSRLAGISPPVDGICQDIQDIDTLHNDSIRARRMGFGGKLCIHPAQVDEVNKCFTYSEGEITWAKKILSAVEESQGSIISLEGKMIDRPVIERAKAILDSLKNH